MRAPIPGGFRVVVDDDGTGTELVRECDDTNNTASWTDTVCE